MKELDFSKVTAKLESVVKELEGVEAQAGWFESAQYEDGTLVAYVAAIQEFGAPEQSIPPRPFMKPAVEDNKEELISQMKKGAKAVARGKLSATDMFDAIGEAMAGNISKAISQVDSPELSKITLALRKRRELGLPVNGKIVGEVAAQVDAGTAELSSNTKPLNETGYMLATVSHKVKTNAD